MSRRAVVWAAGVACSLALLPTSTATASDDGPVAPPAGRALLVGDSIARGVAGRFAGRHPDFVLDAVPGRRVVSLAPRLRKDIAAHGVPEQLVVELGTNTAPDWTKADFEAALDLLPPSTRVVMVTPYVRHNHGAAWSPRGSRAAARTRRYAAWEDELAAERPHVCIAPWRAVVMRRPGLVTHAGVHPTARGKRVFLRLLDATLARCD